MRLMPWLAIALIPLPLCAETPMTPEAFEAYSTGKTLSYSVDGRVYGTEVYKPGHQVIWAFTKDECREGHWYAQGPEVCFVYEDPNDPQCWLFYLRGDQLWAQFTGDGPEAPMSQVADADGPLSCLGPKVGV